MEEKTKIYSFFKAGLLLALCLLVNTQVQADIILKALNDKVCPGHPVAIKVERTGTDANGGGKYIKLYKSTAENGWDEKSYVNVNPNNTSVRDSIFVVNMEGDHMWFRAFQSINGGWNDQTIDGSTPIKVVAGNKDCLPSCHSTTLGDDLMGTDFNPYQNQSNPKIPNDIVHYFGDYDIEINSSGYNNYKITDNVTEFFGQTPYLDSKKNEELGGNFQVSNYYYTATNMSGKICRLTYKGNNCEDFSTCNSGKFYQFNMRMYLMPTCTNSLNDATFIARTEHGDISSDKISVDVYNETTGQKIQTVESTGDRVRVRDLLDLSSSTNKLFRLEVTYNGRFPFNTKDPARLQNNGAKTGDYPLFTFEPMFEQFDCAKIAVDYISSAVQNICMDHGVICLGEKKNIKSVGFSNDAVYKWEMSYDLGKTWNQIAYGSDKKEIDVNPPRPGYFPCRVSDANHPGSYVYFNIGVQQCTPPRPDVIKGPNKICYPNENDGVEFEAYYSLDGKPNNDPRAVYHWAVYYENDKNSPIAALQEPIDPVTGATSINQWGPVKFVDIDPNSNYGKVKLIFSKDFPNAESANTFTFGQFWVRCHLFYDGSPVTPVYVDKLVTVYRKPELSYELDRPICPFKDNKVEVTVKPEEPYPGYYTFTHWWNVEHRTGDPETTQYVKFNEGLGDKCKLTDMLVAVRAFVTDMEACDGDKGKNNEPVNNNPPRINCTDLANQFNDLFKNYSYTHEVDAIVLSPDKQSVTFKLPLPKIEDTCDDNPTITITGSGIDVNKKEFKFETSGLLSEIKKNDNAITVTLNVSAGKVGDNGYTFSYSVKDGCNRQSNICAQKIIIRDEHAPEFECIEKMPPNYTDIRLSSISIYLCNARPGVNDEVLPQLTAPEGFKDQAGEDVEITYCGRLWKADGKDVPNPEDTDIETKFDKTIGLNDDFKPGYNYILWKFADKVGNAKYCIQLVSVIDDKKPNVDCGKTDLGKKYVNEDCQLSFYDIFLQIPKEDLPTAIDLCKEYQKVPLDSARLVYKKQGDANFIELTKENYTDKNIFKKGNVYEFEWRFYIPYSHPNADRNVYKECRFQVEVADSFPPIIDCSNFVDVSVPFNSNSKYSNEITYNYASGSCPAGEDCHMGNKDEERATPSGPTPGRASYKGDYNKYTLAEYFQNYKIPTFNDKCDGDISPKVILVDKDGKTETVVPGTDAAEKIAYLNSYKFLEGTYTVRFEYSDLSGNTASCSHKITVYSSIYTNCKEENVRLEADVQDCHAVYNLKLEEVPTARVNFIRDYRMKEYYYANANTSLVKLEDTYQSSFPPGNNVKKQYTEFPILQDKTETQEYLVYPSIVTKYEVTRDDNGLVTENKLGSLTNTATNEPFKILAHMYCSNYKENRCEYSLLNDPNSEEVVETISLYTQNFKIKQDELTKFLTFDHNGQYKLEWEFSDGQGTIKKCVQTINVVDVTPPAIECGKWERSAPDVLYTTDNQCSFPDKNGKLTLDELKNLQGQDNCTATEELKISYKREYWQNEVGSNTDAANKTTTEWTNEEFPIGVTKITWIISDLSNNKKECKATIIVRDEQAPKVICDPDNSENKYYPDLTFPARQDGCYALGTEIFPADYMVPVVLNDECSPVKENGEDIQFITGVGTRDDGKPFNSGYYHKEPPTVIEWKFCDARKNCDYCLQRVVIVDESNPKLDCSKLEDNSYTLPIDQCEASLEVIKELLTEPTANDNCTATGSIQFTNNAPETFPIGTTTVIWTATDEAGNGVSIDANTYKVCAQNITVIDTSIPKGECPVIMPIDADKGTCSVLASEILNKNSLLLKDGCDKDEEGNDKYLEPLFYTRSDNKDMYEPFPVGITEVSWYYQDASNNKKYCKQTVVVNDITDPVLISCKNGEKETLKLEVANGACDLPVKTVVDAAQEQGFIPTAEDDCDKLLDLVGYRYFLGKDKENLETPNFNVDGIKWNDHTVPYEPGYYIIRFYYFDDDKNKTQPCDIKLFIRDVNAPEVTCEHLVGNIQLTPLSNKECDRVVTLNDLNATGIFATEFCDDSDDKKTYEAKPWLNVDGLRQDKFTDESSITVTSGHTVTFDWVYTSVHGVETVCKQFVTVKDETLPTCSSTKPVKVNTGDRTTPDCTADANIKIADINAFDACGVSKIEYLLVSPKNDKDENKNDVGSGNGSNDNSGDNNDTDDPTSAKSIYTLVEKDADGNFSDFTLENLAVGTHTIYWVLTDVNNQEANAHLRPAEACTTTIVVTDNVPPAVTCNEIPADKNTLETTGGKCYVTGAEVAGFLKPYMPTATDDCHKTGSKALDTVVYLNKIEEANIVSSKWYLTTTEYKPGEKYTLNFVFKDSNGNLADACPLTFVVKDNNAPIVNCEQMVKADKVLHPSASECAVTVNIDSLGRNMDYKIVEFCNEEKDIEDENIKPWIKGEDGTLTEFNDSQLAPGDELNIVWVVTSDAGVANDECEQKVTVEDKQAPVCTGGEKLSFNTDQYANADNGCLVDAEIELNHIGYSDNCDESGENISFAYRLDDALKYTTVSSEDKEAGKIKIEGLDVATHVIYWQLTDKDGNVKKDAPTCSTTVVVTDNTAPECKGGDAITVHTSNKVTPDCYADTTVALSHIVATDNCAVTKYEYKKPGETDFTEINLANGENFADKKVDVTNLAVGTNTITWQVTDAAGLTGTCTTDIVVKDNTAPTCTSTVITGVSSSECTLNYKFPLVEINAKDNCEGKVSYAYVKLSGDEIAEKKEFKEEDYTEYTDSDNMQLEVGENLIIWMLKDEKGNTRIEACTTSVKVASHVKVQDPDCKEIAPVVGPIEINDCGPATDVVINKPEITDPCTNTKYKGETEDELTNFPLGHSTVHWIFKNNDDFQIAQCDQTVIIKTTQEIDPKCPTTPTKVDLKDGKCTEDVVLEQVYAQEPCNGVRLEGTPFKDQVEIEKNSDGKYVVTVAMNTTIVWKFEGDTSKFKVPTAECNQEIEVSNNNETKKLCSDHAVNMSIDGCDVDAKALDFQNTGVNDINICPENELDSIIPDLWLNTWLNEEGKPTKVVHNPKDLGTFKPGEYTLYWHYQYKPGGISTYDANCEQKITITSTKEFNIACDDSSHFKTIFPEADENCKATVTLDPAKATHDCFKTVDEELIEFSPVGTRDDGKALDDTYEKTTIVTWTYNLNNEFFPKAEAQCTTKVIVTDKTAPTVTCQEDITYSLTKGDDGKQNECEASPAKINLQRPTVEDNCTAEDDLHFWIEREYEYKDNNGEIVKVNTDSSDAFKPGTHLITWTVRDKADNAASCSMKVVVKDEVPPVIDECPADILDLKNAAGLCEVDAKIKAEDYKRIDQCNNFEMTPTAVRKEYDHATKAWVVVDKEISEPYPVGTTIIEWTYRDESGNPSTVCKQKVVVTDTEKPVVNCTNTANPISKELEKGKCDIDGSTVIEDLNAPTATDQCGDGAMEEMVSTIWYFGRMGDDKPILQVDKDNKAYEWDKMPSYVAGHYEIHFIFADTTGLKDSCVQKIFIKDTNIEDGICEKIEDQKLNPAQGECEVAIHPFKLNPYQGHEVCPEGSTDTLKREPFLLNKVVTKKADGTSETSFELANKDIPSSLNSGDTIYIRWVYTSQMGVTQDCDQMITVEDNQKPVLPCAVTPLETIELVADKDECNISAANANVPVPTAKDNCGEIVGKAHRYEFDQEKKVWVYQKNKTLEDAYPVGTTKIWWIFADSNPANTDSCEQYIFVQNSMEPLFDCDTLKPLFDTIPECDVTVQSLKVPTPVALDACSKDTIKNVTSVRSDGKDVNDPYPLGNTTISWTFTDSTGTSTKACEQVVNIRTEQNLIMNCPKDTMSVALESGCDTLIKLEPQLAQHPCFTDVTVEGKPYLNDETEVSDLERRLPGGIHKITWVFEDVTNSLVKPIDTCYQFISVGNDSTNMLPCKDSSFSFVLDKVCSVGANEINLKTDPNADIEVDDICNGDKKAALEIWRTSWVDKDGNFTKEPVSSPTELGSFGIGRDTVIWKYTFNPSGIEGNYFKKYCKQPILVRDSNVLDAKCGFDDVLTTLNAGKECELPMDAVLDSFGTKLAHDACIDEDVVGVPHIVVDKELVQLPSSDYTKLSVGDTIHIKWMFTNPEKNADTVYCDQNVTAISSQAPTDLKCDSLKDAVEDYIAKEACDYVFGDKDFKAPVGKDACTDDPVPAVGHFKSNGEPIVGATLSVGHDTIVWVFTSPYSSVSDSCEQPIRVLDSAMIDVQCLPDDSLTILSTGSATCDMKMEDLLKGLGTPTALDKCKNTPIDGDPYYINKDGNTVKVVGNEVISVKDTITVIWMFNNPELNKDTAKCAQKVTLHSEKAPTDLKCDSLKDAVEDYIAKEACEYVFGDKDFKAPVGKDACTDDPVPAVGHFKSNGEPIVGATLSVGYDTIVWVFTSPYSSVSDSCEQPIHVLTDKQLDGQCTAENYPDLVFIDSLGKCVFHADSITKKLTAHNIFVPCLDNVLAKVDTSRSDGLPMDAPYAIGTTTITWTFTDTTNSLVVPTSECKQVVIVKDQNDPKVDCPVAFPDTTLYLDADNCSLDLAQIPVKLENVPTGPCSNEVAKVDTARTDAKLHDPYGVGKHEIVWTFTFPSTNRTTVCKQNIDVLDTLAPAFNCDQLKDTILVEITSSGSSVTYDQVVEKGFEIPTVEDKCTEVTMSVKRDDNKALEKDFELGTTKVTFIFADAYGNADSCSQIVNVVDMIPPVINCPDINKPLACMSELDEPYASYDEFVAAGGSVSDVDRVDVTSFRHEDEVEGDECEAVVTRNYIFTTIRNVEVQCKVAQKFNMKDTIAPVFHGMPESGLEATTSCDMVETDTIPPVITVSDNCDDDVVMKVERVSYQSNDPADCHHYTYDVKFTYTAEDRCGNKADTMIYTIHVVDTVPPHVTEPEDWKDMIHPIYKKECIFAVPDITNMIPRENIYQNCGENEYVTFRQEPEAGSPVTETTDIKLIISDVCGNDTVLTKKLLIQKREDIIKLVAENTSVCADETAFEDPRLPSIKNSLSSDYIRMFYGMVWIEDFDGTWVTTQAQVVSDCYRDTISDATVKYSDNPFTYADKFEDANYDGDDPVLQRIADQNYGKYNLLLRRSQSDNYVYIVTDTITGCADTARIYIDVMERPRLALETGEWNLCEGDSLALSGDFGDKFPVCVNDMGAAITEEGWILNGDNYKPQTSVNYDEGIDHIAAYYATNECGTTTSLNSLAVSCDGALHSAEDSIAFAGTADNLELLKKDSLYTADSVFVKVFTHYDPAQVLIITKPETKPRVWDGDRAELIVTLPYEDPAIYKWMQVVGEFDGEQGAVYDRDGNIVSGGSGENDDVELDYRQLEDSTHFLYKNRLSVYPADTTNYYVVVGNGVCPAVISNITNVDVMHKLPTAFTPYSRDGYNDHFMKGHVVSIFNRYGQLLFQGNDGWNGYYRGLPADPGVYYYEVEMKSGKVYKGSIEIVKVIQ